MCVYFMKTEWLAHQSMEFSEHTPQLLYCAVILSITDLAAFINYYTCNSDILSKIVSAAFTVNYLMP